MASALGFQSQGVPAQPQMAPQFSNFQQLMNGFNQFRQSFSGDARQTVQQLLQSGKMSQAQYNQYAQMATQFVKMMGR